MSMRKTLPFLSKKANRKSTFIEEPVKPTENNVESLKAPREDLYEKLAPTEHLHKILSSPESSYYFKKFVTRKFCSETLSFWVAVEHYRHSKELNISLFTYAKEIYSSYLMHGGDKEVNLENQQRDLDISVPDETTFDHLQNIAWQLLVTSDYPKFVNSTEYKEYLDNQPLKPLRRTVTLERLDDIIKFGFKLQTIQSSLADSDSVVQLTSDRNNHSPQKPDGKKEETENRNNSDELSEEFVISSDDEFDSNSNRKIPQEDTLIDEDIPKDLPSLESPEPEVASSIEPEIKDVSEEEKEIESPPAEVVERKEEENSPVEEKSDDIEDVNVSDPPAVEEAPKEDVVPEPEPEPPVVVEIPKPPEIVVSIPVPENVKALDEQWDEIHRKIQSIREKREQFLVIHKQQTQQYQSMVSKSSLPAD